LDAHIKPEGWDNWRDPARENWRFADTVSGARSESSARVSWSRQLDQEISGTYATKLFLKGNRRVDSAEIMKLVATTMKCRMTALILIVTLGGIAPGLTPTRNCLPPPLRSRGIDALRQKAEWYHSDEAVRSPTTYLSYQRDIGGWPKNIDMRWSWLSHRVRLSPAKKHADDSTIDNGATYTQLKLSCSCVRGARFAASQKLFSKVSTTCSKHSMRMAVGLSTTHD